MEGLVERFNRAGDGTMVVPADHLDVVAIRLAAGGDGQEDDPCTMTSSSSGRGRRAVSSPRG
jgi:hypothetical protein